LLFCHFEEFLHRKVSIFHTTFTWFSITADVYFIIRNVNGLWLLTVIIWLKGLFSLASLFITQWLLCTYLHHKHPKCYQSNFVGCECFFINDIISVSWKKSSILSKASPPYKYFYIVSFALKRFPLKICFIVFSFLQCFHQLWVGSMGYF
jgi:hypothetical protein